MRKLDRIDRMILDILQKNGRIAISELAAKVNLSTTPCSERVKRLERDGIIMGYYARLNPELVDKRLLVFLEIKLSAKSGDVFEAVNQMLSRVGSTSRQNSSVFWKSFSMAGMQAVSFIQTAFSKWW